MSTVEFAREEMTRAGLFDKDSDYGGMLGEAVLELVEKFSAQGHSGFSAGMAVSLFEKLARYEPLTPLTGADDEWVDISEMSGRPMWQNRRCSRVFKGADGQAYDIDAVVFEGADGIRYTSGDSRRAVAFPYTPETEIVKVAEQERHSGRLS